MWCTVVLLKNEQLTAVGCDSRDVFLVAKSRDSGICGVFASRGLADRFIAGLRGALRVRGG